MPMVVTVPPIMVITLGGMVLVGMVIILDLVNQITYTGQVLLVTNTLMVQYSYPLQTYNMKLTLKKTTEEKFEIKVINSGLQMFHNELHYMYMGREVFGKESSLDMVEQLKGLFNNINEIENDFDV
jgi:hypothetical protein